jgi:hypothetical protein
MRTQLLIFLPRIGGASKIFIVEKRYNFLRAFIYQSLLGNGCCSDGPASCPADRLVRPEANAAAGPAQCYCPSEFG